MPQTRGRGRLRKDESSHEQSKTYKHGRGRGQNDSSQETVNRGRDRGSGKTQNRGRGRRRGKKDSSSIKKKTHLLDKILEDSDYENPLLSHKNSDELVQDLEIQKHQLLYVKFIEIQMNLMIH